MRYKRLVKSKETLKSLIESAKYLDQDFKVSLVSAVESENRNEVIRHLSALEAKLSEAEHGEDHMGEMMVMCKQAIMAMKKFLAEMSMMSDDDKKTMMPMYNGYFGRFRETIDLLETVDPDRQGFSYKVHVIKEGPTKTGGKIYSKKAIQDVVEKLNGVKLFANHPSKSEQDEQPERTVENVAGWYKDPKLVQVVGSDGKLVYAAEATLHMVKTGPKAWLGEAIRQAYEQGNPSLYGISIVGQGVATQDRNTGSIVVESVDSLLSADLVTYPNAGGEILAIQEDELSQEVFKKVFAPIAESVIINNSNDTTEINTTIEESVQKMPDTNVADLTVKVAELQKELEVSKSQTILREAVSASTDLTPKAKEKLLKQFSGRVFEKAELDTAITEQLDIIKEATSAVKPVIIKENAPIAWAVSNLPTSGTTKSEADTYKDAFYAMVAGIREKNGTKAFSSLKEAYWVINKGQVDPFDNTIAYSIFREAAQYGTSTNARLKEATIQTSTYTHIMGSTVYRVLLDMYHTEDVWTQWKLFCSTIGSAPDFKTQQRIHFGGYNMMTSVGEGATYTEYAAPSEERATLAVTKYGKTAPLTFEAIVNDDLNALRRIPRMLSLQAKVLEWDTVVDLFRTNSSYTGDSTVLFEAAGTHNNMTTSALTAATLETGMIAMRRQKVVGTTDIYIVPTPKYLVIPYELEDMAFRLKVSPSNVGSTNEAGREPNIFSQSPRFKFEYVVMPDATDATDWFLIADPMSAPTIEALYLRGQEEPELWVQDDGRVGSAFTADKITYKIRHIFGAGLVDYRTFYGGYGVS